MVSLALSIMATVFVWSLGALVLGLVGRGVASGAWRVVTSAVADVGAIVEPVARVLRVPMRSRRGVACAAGTVLIAGLVFGPDTPGIVVVVLWPVVAALVLFILVSPRARRPVPS